MSRIAALRAGTRLKSAVSDAEVLIVRAPAAAVELTCGGFSLLALQAPVPPPTSDARTTPEGELSLGKRYFDEASGLEVLCTKAGAGTLSCDGRPLEIREPKPLPSSD